MAVDMNLDADFWPKARRSAELARLAYRSYEEIHENVPDAEYININETVAFVCKPDDTHNYLHVAFRGTDINEFENVLTDLDFKRDRALFLPGTVHGGFKDAVNLIWDELEPKCAPYMDGKVVFCGHSLGAALAIIAAAKFDRPNIDVITFGAPRIGDKKFVNNVKCKDRVYRFINKFDLVTRSPWRLWGYADIGHVLRFGYGGNVVEKITERAYRKQFGGTVKHSGPEWSPHRIRGLPFSEISLVFKQLTHSFTGVIHFEKESLADHDMGTYLENTKNAGGVIDTRGLDDNKIVDGKIQIDVENEANEAAEKKHEN